MQYFSDCHAETKAAIWQQPCGALASPLTGPNFFAVENLNLANRSQCGLSLAVSIQRIVMVWPDVGPGFIDWLIDWLIAWLIHSFIVKYCSHLPASLSPLQGCSHTSKHKVNLFPFVSFRLSQCLVVKCQDWGSPAWQQLGFIQQMWPPGEAS